jgi:hypothetical protein
LRFEDAIAFALEIVAQQRRERGLVLDDQNRGSVLPSCEILKDHFGSWGMGVVDVRSALGRSMRMKDPVTM